MTRVELIVHGNFVHSKSFDELEVLEASYVGVDNKGSIVFMASAEEMSGVEAAFGFTLDDFDGRLVDTLAGKDRADGTFIVPGYIDTHVHAPQYAFAGLGLDMPLLQWLETYTYPMEARFADTDFAAVVYKAMLKRMVAAGTTTACMFGTLHAPASVDLARYSRDVGLRGLVGKVCMDSHAPDNYIEPSAEDSLAATKDFVRDVLALDNARVRPVITPRFAPSCSAELLAGLGQLATDFGGLHIQSHISESPAEIAWVRDLFPDAASYADVYAAAGLLTKRTVMAHGIHLTPDEMSLFARARTGVSHCPASNFGLTSGILNVLDLVQYDIDVGLGTDVAGGPAISILDAMRLALVASKILTMPQHQANRKPNSDALSIHNVFYMATMGGARVLDMHHSVGSFAVGKQFDAVVVDALAPDSPFDVFATDTSLHALFEKYLILGDDRNHAAVYVAGELIHTRETFSHSAESSTTTTTWHKSPLSRRSRRSRRSCAPQASTALIAARAASVITAAAAAAIAVFTTTA
ncbi:guanine deaminase [Thecamonas trahens ATCC 50062]|uniref:Guanine deaminase n=1 Tax=Thecamonas trahens ATCC 50062 TaxID=461836 RepID=A0A0L0D3T5_THETB|nr:guanine deaminase [Thecamonas trahens ATCC 50062]KNC46974.1 guanine deaminase [Thecamonas trahens ATCC 50062]|eukprot:XP_013760245.1 guanine deaminase [Thecamonas trahens ATCC 50062]